MDLEKMQNLSQAFIDKFKDAATELVMNEVTNTDEENIKKIIMFTARDMAIGAVLKRNEYIAIGIGIGVGITSLTFAVSNKVTKQKIEMDTYDVHIEKRNVNKAFEEVSVSQSKVVDKKSVNKDGNEESILDRVNEILKKPSNLEDLKDIIKELKDNENK